MGVSLLCVRVDVSSNFDNFEWISSTVGQQNGAVHLSYYENNSNYKMEYFEFIKLDF